MRDNTVSPARRPKCKLGNLLYLPNPLGGGSKDIFKVKNADELKKN